LWHIVDVRVLGRGFGITGRRVIRTLTIVRTLTIAHIKPCCGFAVTERCFPVADSTPFR
jgi:hypothetical protein